MQEIAEDPGVIAKRLKAQADPLARTWLERLAEQGAQHVTLAIVGPQALNALAIALETSNAFDASPFATELHRVALTRHLQGVTITELLDELAVLHTLVLAELSDLSAGPEPVQALSVAWQELVRALVLAHEQQPLGEALAQSRTVTRYARKLNHDLRNHLYALQMHLRLMQEDRILLDEERRTDLLARARETTRGLADLPPSLLASMLQGELMESQERAPLGHVLRDAVELAGAYAEARGVELRIEGQVPSDPVPADLLLVALVELIARAAEGDRSGPGAVVLRARSGDERLLLELEHGGKHPHPEQLFALGGRVLGRDEQELAGLWMARQLIQAAGGGLQVQQAAGGTLVRIELPISAR